MFKTSRMNSMDVVFKKKFGDFWQKHEKSNPDFYEKLFDNIKIKHENFLDYLRGLKKIETVLEVGCGTGIYPTKYYELLGEYTGIDISKPAIEHCKRTLKQKFICDDFVKHKFDSKFDFVFSHSVIDHVPDIDGFIKKIVFCTKKHAYVSAYRGYFPKLEQHQQQWHKDGYYLNDVSLSKLSEALLDAGIKKDEFLIKLGATGHKERPVETIIIIEKS